MRALAIVATIAAGCGPRARERFATPREGVAIAIYAGDRESLGVVDDRRYVEIENGSMILDRIDADAALPSLAMEPLDGRPLALGACVRERIAETSADTESTMPPLQRLSPVVRCRVDAPSSERRFVRIVYVTPRLSYAAHHDVSVRGDRAIVSTRYTIATPPWRAAGDVALFRGVPGGPRGTRELARGAITLDGGIGVLPAAPRELPAQIRFVYDGALRERDVDPTSDDWNAESRTSVIAVLELDGELARGPARVELLEAARVVREVDVSDEARERVAGKLRMPLWIDEDLVGQRKRKNLMRDPRDATDDVILSVSNHGRVRREVIVEERLRPARDRSLRSRSRAEPELVGNVARTRLVIEPGATDRVEFFVDYGF